MTWQRGVVIAHRQLHEDDNAKGDNPPWKRIVRLDDGTEREFDWSKLYRNGTHPSNTIVGSVVYVSETGGVSAPKPADA